MAWGLIALFLTTRIIYLFFLDPYHFSVFPPEERYIGFIAREILRGLDFPIWQYQANPYLGGSLVIAALAAIPLKLFGETFFILKMVPLALFSLTLYAGYRLCDRFFGKSVAFLFGLLYIFSPPSWTQYTVTALGSHAEATLFTLFCFIILFRILFKKERVWDHYLALGLAGGVGIWFAYSTLPAFLVILTFLFLSEPLLLTRKRGWLLILGIFAGLIPWFFYNLGHAPGAGFIIENKPIWDHFSISNVKNIMDHKLNFVGFGFLHSLTPGFWGVPGWTKTLSLALYAPILIFPLLFTFILKPKFRFKPLFIIFIYTLSYLTIVQFSDFKSLRYFLPLHPFLFILVAIGMVKALNSLSKFSLPLRLVYISCLIVAFALSHLPFLRLNDMGQIFRTRSYAYQFLDTAVCKDAKPCFQNLEALSEGLTDSQQHELYAELGAWITSRLWSDDLSSMLEEIDPQIPASFRSYFYYFLGRDYVKRNTSLDSLDQVSKIIANNYNDIWPLFLMGVLDAYGQELEIEFPKDFKLPQYLTDHYLQAQGQRYFAYMPPESILQNDQVMQRYLQSVLQQVKLQYHASFLRGVGIHLYEIWSLNVKKPAYSPVILDSLPLAYRSDILRGIGMGWERRNFSWRIADESWYEKHFSKGLSPQSREQILEGKQLVLQYFMDHEEK